MILELVGLFLCIFLLVKLIRDENKDLPPGPWGLPIFGHLFALGTTPHKVLMDWKQKYGPIIYCRFGSFRTVVLNDAKLIKQAFSMSEFAGRAEIVPFVQGSQKKGVVFSEGFHNTEQRQFTLRNLRDLGLGKKTIESKIQDGLLDLLAKIEEREGKPMKSTRMTNANIVSTLWTVLMTEPLSKDKLNELAEIVQEKVNHLGPLLSQLALFLPWLETVTQALTLGSHSLIQFKTDGLRELYSFMENQILRRKETRVKYEPRDFNDVYLDKVDDTKDTSSSFHEKNSFGSFVVGDLFMGGIETSSTTIEWLLNHMARHPEIQRKLQEEIDNVVGISRLPSLSDKTEMPYTEAIIYEILRISSLLPLGVHHQTLADVTFQNYRIPKNTMVLANFYAVHHDPEVWGDPENFRPERWLVGGEEVKRLKGEYFLPFGCGKRGCVGEVLARDQLYLYVSSIFQRYTVSFPGNKVPEMKSILGIALGPEPFEVVFNAREVHEE